MSRKWICCALLLFLLPAGLRVSAEEAAGTINCWLQYGEVQVTDCSLEICQAGFPVPEGYRLKEEFGGGVIAGEDIPSDTFAGWMAEKAAPGYIKWANSRGAVHFEHLEPGIYLIRQSQESELFYPVKPYLACVTEEVPVVDTYPKLSPKSSIPRTEQDPALYIGCLGFTAALGGILCCIREKLIKNA